jgi:dolichyl-phosphate beta-glucosyltransferase
MESNNTTSNGKQYDAGTAPEVSVVIPAYNESHHIPKILQAIDNFFHIRNLSREIILVNDGSHDNTEQIALSFRDSIAGLTVLGNDRNRGKGFSVRKGMLKASGSLILMTDADQSSPIEEFDKLLPPVRNGHTDIAIGSRALKNSEIIVHQPFYREPLGYLYNDFIQLLILKGIEDTQCGFKLFRREVARDVFSRVTVNGFAFDVEALHVAKKLGYRITEVPIQWRNDPDTRVKLIRHGTKMLIDLLRIRWNSWRGMYK